MYNAVVSLVTKIATSATFVIKYLLQLPTYFINVDSNFYCLVCDHFCKMENSELCI